MGLGVSETTSYCTHFNSLLVIWAGIHICYYVYMYLVRLHWFEASAEVLKLVPLFVHLHSLSIVLDLSVHAIRTLLYRRGNSTTSLCLQVDRQE